MRIVNCLSPSINVSMFPICLKTFSSTHSPIIVPTNNDKLYIYANLNNVQSHTRWMYVFQSASQCWVSYLYLFLSWFLFFPFCPYLFTQRLVSLEFVFIVVDVVFCQMASFIFFSFFLCMCVFISSLQMKCGQFLWATALLNSHIWYNAMNYIFIIIKI